jgi:hypothetical protein
MGSTEKFMASNKSSFKVGDGQHRKKLTSNKSALKVGDG